MIEQETVTVMEPALFTDYVKKQVGAAPVSELMPLVKYVGADWDLNVSRLKHFNIIKRIIINSAKNN